MAITKVCECLVIVNNDAKEWGKSPLFGVNDMLSLLLKRFRFDPILLKKPFLANFETAIFVGFLDFAIGHFESFSPFSKSF